MILKEKYNEISVFLEKKTYEIWKHENDVHYEKGESKSEMFQEGFSIKDCYCITKGCITIYFVFNYSFFKGILNDLIIAIKSHSQLFGTGDATDVIEALYKVSNSIFDNKDEYISYLKNYACCYVLLEKEANLQPEILRLDMLRLMKVNRKEPDKKDFVGGLLHSLKHFSINEQNLSTGKDINDVSDVTDILYNIAYAFTKYIQENVADDSIVIQNKNGKEIMYGFYKEEITGVFYLDTCHRI